MSEAMCSTCVHYSLYKMITSEKPFGYSGEIPCESCSHYMIFTSKYVQR